MHHTTITLTIFAALTVTACGGGSSKDQTEVPKKPSQVTILPAIQSFNSHAFGRGNTVPSSVKRAPTGLTNYQANTDNSLTAFNSINIDGKKYAIATKGKNQERYNYLGSASYNTVSSGGFLSYSRFGVLNLKGYTNDAFFAFGQYTLGKDMPNVGKATYHGYGLHQHKDEAKLIATEVNADVDFSAKTAAIGIKGDHIDFSLSGNVNGNKILGNNNLRAAFYGPDGKELAGSYSQNGNGVFGTVRK